jgi:tetratricopeptide (TPR) repeat protein
MEKHKISHPTKEHLTKLLKSQNTPDEIASMLIDNLKIDGFTIAAERDTAFLDELVRHPEVIYSMIHQIIIDNQLENGIILIWQLIDLLGDSNEAKKLEDEIMNLWLSPEDSLGYASLGHAWSLLDQYEYSLAAYDRSIELDRDYIDAYIYRGIMYFYMENYQSAIKDFDHALKMDPQNILALANKGYALIELERFDEALSVLNAALEQDPNDVWVIHERGRIYSTLGQYDQALDDYEQVINLDPGHKYAYANKGYALQELGRLEEALDSFNVALQIDPEYIWALKKRALLYEGMGNPEKAISDYKRTILLDPSDNVIYVNLGNLLKDLTRYEEAIENFNQAIKLDPGYVQAFNERGLLHLAMGHYDLALSDFERAIDLDPSNKWAFANKGSILGESGDYQNALAALEMAIQIDPEYIWAIHEIGRLFSIQDKYDMAIEYYDRVIALDPQYKWAYANKAYAQRELNRIAESLETYSKALEIDPDYIWVLNERSKTYWMNNDLQKAVDDLDHIFQIDGPSVSNYQNRANLYLNIGLANQQPQQFDDMLAAYRKSLDDLNRAINLDRENMLTYWLLGAVLSSVGAYDQSTSASQRALELAGDATRANIAAIYWNLGVALREWGQISQEQDRLKRSLKSLEEANDYFDDESKRFEVICDQVQVLMRLKRYKDAVKLLEKAHQFNPDHTWTLCLLGQAHLKVGNNQAAKADFEILVEKGNDSDAYTDYGWIGLGVIANRSHENGQEAEKYYNKALPRRSEVDEQSYMNRARIFTFFEEYNRVETDLKAALDFAPNSAAVCNTLAWFYADTIEDPRKLETAVDLASKAISLTGKIPVCGHYLDTLGWAYFKLGRYTDAIKALSKAAELLPELYTIRYHQQRADKLSS